MSRAFYELCYDQYMHEMREADGHYRRAGVVLTAIPIIGVSAIALGRLEILGLCFRRVDAFLFYLGFAITSGGLMASISFLYLSVHLRGYKTLAKMNVWHKWTEEYKAYMASENTSDASESTDLGLFDNVTARLVEAQPVNADINEKRRKAFAWSVEFAAIAVVGLVVEAIFSVILKIQGI